MINVKRNYKKDKCTSYVETQQPYIQEEYVELHQDGPTILTKDDLFKEDVYHLKEIANKLQQTIDKLIQIEA